MQVSWLAQQSLDHADLLPLLIASLRKLFSSVLSVFQMNEIILITLLCK